MKRIAQRALIGAAALAAIASQPPSWYLNQHAEIPPATLDDQTRTVRYIIHNELRGAGPFKYLDGNMTISFAFSPMPSAGIAFTMNGLTHPDRQSSSGTLTGAGNDYQYLSVWLDCTAACNEDFEIVLTRQFGETEAVQITGTVDIDANGDGDEAPAGTEIVTTIEGPL